MGSTREWVWIEEIVHEFRSVVLQFRSQKYEGLAKEPKQQQLGDLEGMGTDYYWSFALGIRGNTGRGLCDLKGVLF